MNVDLVSYSDSDLVSSQQPSIRLSTNALRMHVRKTADDATVWIEATTDNGMLKVTVGENFDTVLLTIKEAKLLTLPAGEYVHSLIMETQYAERVEIWRGKLTHNAGPTRWTDEPV